MPVITRKTRFSKERLKDTLFSTPISERKYTAEASLNPMPAMVIGMMAIDIIMGIIIKK